MSVPNSYTYDLEGTLVSQKTAEFSGRDGSGSLLNPFYIGPANYAVQTGENQASVGGRFYNAFMGNLPGIISDEFVKKGFHVLGVQVIAVGYTWKVVRTGTWWMAPFVAADLAECQLTMTWKARVTLDKPATHSPVAPWVFELIKYVGTVVLIALIAYWVIEAVKDVMTSMLTTTTTVTEYNPDGTKKSETKTSNPALASQVAVIVVVLGGLAIGGYYLLNIMGKKQQPRRQPRPR